MKKLKNILRIVLFVAVMLALVGLGVWSWKLQTDNKRLQQENKTQSDELASRGKRISDLETEGADAKRTIDQLRLTVQPLQEESKSLKENISAFATQAASCEALKQKLNHKG
jgi:septal ring factor EnvC (AmiA/AmiB activator)